MLSRIADSMFWLNRYMERAEGLLRVTSTNYTLSLDKDVNTNLSWKPVLEIFTYADREQVATLQDNTNAVLQLLITDTSNQNSLKMILTRARENARGVQDHITKEVWEQVNHMYHMVNQPDLGVKLGSYEALDVMDDFVSNSLLFTGVTDTTMPRGPGWSFMNLGKQIERCTQTIEITDKQYQSIDYDLDKSSDILKWRSLLLSLSGYELHLKTYRASDFNRDVLHQVLINPNFTRSVYYSLSRINRYLEEVVKANRLDGNDALLLFFGRLRSRVKYVDFETLNGPVLQQFLKEVRHDLLEFSKRLTQHFFSYT